VLGVLGGERRRHADVAEASCADHRLRPWPRGPTHAHRFSVRSSSSLSDCSPYRWSRDTRKGVTARTILEQRLQRQQLIRPTFTTPADLVAWFGAVQAQDFAGAMWALAMRLPPSPKPRRTADALTAAGQQTSVSDVERAFNAGRIVRTHVMRPTWHFVAPEDLGWLQRLTGPRVRQRLAPYDRQLELTAAVLKRSRAVIGRALSGGRSLTRTALGEALSKAGILASGQRLAHIMMHLELDAVICSGPRESSQFTYALANDRISHTKTFEGDAARAELLRRYLQSHGPATLRDFVWWCGLTMRDARTAADGLRAQLHSDVVGNLTYWSLPLGSAQIRARRPLVRTLPNYDEYLIAHQDRGLTAAPPLPKRWPKGHERLFPHVVVIDGRVAGVWRRTITTTTLTLDCRRFRVWSPLERAALEREAGRYASSLGVRAKIAIVGG
jgi:hypothetical protein